MKGLLIIVFIITLLAQWYIPASTIFSKQKVLKEGKVFYFKARPVDPEHPFKGRYLIMNFEAETMRIDSSLTAKNGQKAYAGIKAGTDNIASISSLSLHRPVAGTDYLEVEIAYIDFLNDSRIAHLKFPFREYYLKETNARKAEQIYFHSVADPGSVTSAVVKVLNGEAVLTGIRIGDKEIQELLSE